MPVVMLIFPQPVLDFFRSDKWYKKKFSEIVQREQVAYMLADEGVPVPESLSEKDVHDFYGVIAPCNNTIHAKNFAKRWQNILEGLYHKIAKEDLPNGVYHVILGDESGKKSKILEHGDKGSTYLARFRAFLDLAAQADAYNLQGGGPRRRTVGVRPRPRAINKRKRDLAAATPKQHKYWID